MLLLYALSPYLHPQAGSQRGHGDARSDGPRTWAQGPIRGRGGEPPLRGLGTAVERAEWTEETLSPGGPHRHHLNPAPQETRGDPSLKRLQFPEDSSLHVCQSPRRTWGSEELESCHATLLSTPVSLCVAMEGRPSDPHPTLTLVTTQTNLL